MTNLTLNVEWLNQMDQKKRYLDVVIDIPGKALYLFPIQT